MHSACDTMGIASNRKIIIIINKNKFSLGTTIDKTHTTNAYTHTITLYKLAPPYNQICKCHN